MNRSLIVGLACACVLAFVQDNVQAQRNCGTPILLDRLKREQPADYARLQAEKKQLLETTKQAAQSGAQMKTTAQHPIPVVFHFLITEDEYNYLGQNEGIIRRVRSQIKQLNADFSGTNADKYKIPPAFLPVFGNANIQFGLASATSSATISNGIEVKILSAPAVYDVNYDCYTAKENTAVGFPAWDPSKYLNIWVARITSGMSGTILGITTPPSFLGHNVGTMSNPHYITEQDFGIVLNYGAIGVREFPGQSFITNIDKGRTLTHEMGHYFELSHTWGDDGGLCPTNGGQDDDIADTPPEAGSQFGSPSYPVYDACTKSTSGTSIMFMNFMDYVDDGSMQMFTKDQVSRMQAFIQPGYESYSLTQNPGLTLGVHQPVAESSVTLSPNPASSKILLSLTGSNHFLSADVVNLLGQSVAKVPANGTQSISIDLSDMPKGIYLVKCQFTEGTLTRKFVLQ
ncbi:MAG: zinc-dependent metalloprotease [Bacteroidetes bacterium]|nr:zinc-dependent metalloprotease [Bacteroidota bacterium]